MSGRNFRRLCVRQQEDGVEGLRDRRIGKLSPRRAPTRELERMHELYRERYSDFTVKHFHEQLVKRHDYKLCYTVTKAPLQAAGLFAEAKPRGARRKKRERRPQPGMLLFQDGSTHRWIAGLGRDLDLVVTLNDVTSAICSALLVEQEGTMSSFLGLAETIARLGLFGALYTDRGDHITPRMPARSTRRSRPRSAAPTRYEESCKCFTAPDAVKVEQALISTREPLDQPVKVFTAFAERFHRDAFLLAVDAHVVHVARKPGMPVGWNAGIAQITAIGPGGAHHRDDGHPGP
jgi:hypothetical protein